MDTTTAPAQSLSAASHLLDLSDPRSLKAVEIAATAGQWLKCRLADGRKAYGVPSSSNPNHYYLANCQGCTCPDHQRRARDCKHILAVRFHCALVKAHQQRRQSRTRRAVA